MDTYEKKYKEALEWARKVMQGKVGFVLDDVLEKFPELKESEDEKIRKEIISALKYANYKGVYDKHLAWLEKQGEQNATELSNICEYSLETWIKIVDFVLTEHNGIGNYLDSYETKDTAEKLREKYKFDAASEEWDRVYRKGLDAGVNKGKAIALKEQKPAWSEEDDYNVQCLVAKANCDIQKGNVGRNEELIDWLKSLKERYTWRPSDNELEVLRLAAEKDGACLMGLYEQLKKLKG